MKRSFFFPILPFSFPPPSTADPQISSDMLQSFRRVLWRRRRRRKELFPCDVSTNCALKSDQFRIERSEGEGLGETEGDPGGRAGEEGRGEGGNGNRDGAHFGIWPRSAGKLNGRQFVVPPNCRVCRSLPPFPSNALYRTCLSSGVRWPFLLAVQIVANQEVHQRSLSICPVQDLFEIAL